MAPIFEDGNNKKDRPREDDLFDRSSQGYSLQTVFTRSEKTSANNLYCYVLIKMCSTLKYLSAVGSCPASDLSNTSEFHGNRSHKKGLLAIIYSSTYPQDTFLSIINLFGYKVMYVHILCKTRQSLFSPPKVQ